MHCVTASGVQAGDRAGNARWSASAAACPEIVKLRRKQPNAPARPAVVPGGRDGKRPSDLLPCPLRESVSSPQIAAPNPTWLVRPRRLCVASTTATTSISSTTRGSALARTERTSRRSKRSDRRDLTAVSATPRRPPNGVGDPGDRVATDLGGTRRDLGGCPARSPHLRKRGLLTFPWVGEHSVHRGSGGQRPASRIWRFLTSSGSTEPSRSRGVRTCTGPRSVLTVLPVAPLRAFASAGTPPVTAEADHVK